MKYQNIIIAGALSLGLFSSCDRFLDETPDNRLRLDSYEKVAELVTNAYADGSGVFMEWMSDNVGADPKNMSRLEMTQPYLWQNVEIEGQDTPSYYWSSNYNAIAHANQALEALEQIKENNPAYKKAIRGEALACRAFAHFMLVNVFAKTYDEQTAGTDLGVVIMEKPEVRLLVNYKRSSVKEVYDFIEKDLNEALELVTDEYYKNSGKYHFNKNALLAFATKFFLFKKDYEKAEKYALELFGGSYNSQMIRNYQEVYTGTSDEVMARKFTNPTFAGNLLLIRKDVLYGYKAYAGYRFTEDVYKSIILSKKDQRFIASYGFGGATSFFPKFQRSLVKRTSITSSTGYPYTIEVALRAEEVLFNLLEALTMQGDTKLATFKLFFDKYLKNVYANSIDYNVLESNYKRFFPTLTPQELRLKIVLDEKRREFIEEGVRWFDICRHHLRVVHTDVTGTTSILTENDARKVLQIPETAILYGGLQPNQRENSKEPTASLVIRK